MTKHVFPPSGGDYEPIRPPPSDPPDDQHERRKMVRDPKRAGRRMSVELILMLLAFVVAWMTFLAINTQITDLGAEARFKALLISLLAAGVSYVVNTVAIREGAVFLARGFVGVGAALLAAMIAVGGTLFIGNSAGLILKDAAQMKLVDAGRQMGEVVAQRTAAARNATQVTGIVEAISADINQLLECEIRENCLSRQPGGGRGPVARALVPVAERAITMRDQLKRGQSEIDVVLKALNNELAAYQAAVAQSDAGVWERWASASLIYARIGQTLSRLDEAFPTAAVAAFANEFSSGSTIDHPVAGPIVNGSLKGHGTRLQDALTGGDRVMAAVPSFPTRPGVVTALGYWREFLPILLLVAICELILPVVLFCRRAVEVRWEIEQKYGRYPNDPIPGPSPVSGGRLPSGPVPSQGSGVDRWLPRANGSGDPWRPS